MLLAFDTSGAACTAALFDETGRCLGQADEIIGRGHAERLVPMISELMDGRRASQILVGVGPGSFTGIRVAIAAAHGLAIGWESKIAGVSSLALLAAGASGTPEIAAAVAGGHGELFVQQFAGAALNPQSAITSAAPSLAAKLITARLVVGSGARTLVEARGWGEAQDIQVSAAAALALPSALRSLPPKPLYARAPDARVPAAA